MKLFKATLGMLFVLVLNFSSVSATPSKIFWTVCTTDVYETGTGHIDVDNYFTVFNGDNGQLFPPVVGFEAGVLSLGNWKVEAGLDYYAPLRNPIFFNAGIGINEDLLCCHAPSIKLGFFLGGTKYSGHRRTDANVFDIIVGKTVPKIGGRLFVGGYYGNKRIGEDRAGFMVAYERFFCPAEYCDGTMYNKWKFCADYASGKNILGGGGFGVAHYFTPNVSILTGPVWFNSNRILGDWKWSTQVDISFGIFNNCR